jgi:hypothetical protein
MNFYSQYTSAILSALMLVAGLGLIFLMRKFFL